MGHAKANAAQAQALGQALARLPTGRGSAQGTLVAVAQALVLALAQVYTCGPAVGASEASYPVALASVHPQEGVRAGGPGGASGAGAANTSSTGRSRSRSSLRWSRSRSHELELELPQEPEL